MLCSICEFYVFYFNCKKRGLKHNTPGTTTNSMDTDQEIYVFQKKNKVKGEPDYTKYKNI